MKILIIGSGAIGSFYATMLHQSNANITLAVRSDAETVKKRGITCKSHLGSFTFPSNQIIALGEAVSEPFDVIIIATKSLPSISYPSILAPYLTTKTILACIQNGIQTDLLSNCIIGVLPKFMQ